MVLVESMVYASVVFKITATYLNKAIDCHDLMQKAISFNDALIVYVNGNDSRIHFCKWAR